MVILCGIFLWFLSRLCFTEGSSIKSMPIEYKPFRLPKPKHFPLKPVEKIGATNVANEHRLLQSVGKHHNGWRNIPANMSTEKYLGEMLAKYGIRLNGALSSARPKAPHLRDTLRRNGSWLQFTKMFRNFNLKKPNSYQELRRIMMSTKTRFGRVNLWMSPKRRNAIAKFIYSFITCPIEQEWTDLGVYMYPRYGFTGTCKSNPKRSCSIPPGMHCMTGKLKTYSHLLWKKDHWNKYSRTAAISCQCGCNVKS